MCFLHNKIHLREVLSFNYCPKTWSLPIEKYVLIRIVLAEIQLKLQFAILNINYGINKWCNLVLKMSETSTKVNTWIQKIPYWFSLKVNKLKVTLDKFVKQHYPISLVFSESIKWKHWPEWMSHGKLARSSFIFSCSCTFVRT